MYWIDELYFYRSHNFQLYFFPMIKNVYSVTWFEQNDSAISRSVPMVQVFSYQEGQSSGTVNAENEGKGIRFFDFPKFYSSKVFVFIVQARYWFAE